MNSDPARRSLVKRLQNWLLGATGAIFTAVFVAYALHWIGPKNDDTGQQVISPIRIDVAALEKQYLDEVLEQAETRSGTGEAVTAFVKTAALEGIIMQHVLDKGEPDQTYEYEIRGTTVRVTPSRTFTDAGLECRRLSFSRKTNGEWRGSEQTYCLHQGRWVPKTSTDIVGEQGGEPQNAQSAGREQAGPDTGDSGIKILSAPDQPSAPAAKAERRPLGQEEAELQDLVDTIRRMDAQNDSEVIVFEATLFTEVHDKWLSTLGITKEELDDMDTYVLIDLMVSKGLVR